MFPEEWPQPCPPTHANDANGDYFHLVSSDPLKVVPPDADCRSKCEKFGLGSDGCVKCIGCGLSVFPTEIAVRQQYAFNVALYHRIAKKHMGHIGKATLIPLHGKGRSDGWESSKPHNVVGSKNAEHS